MPITIEATILRGHITSTMPVSVIMPERIVKALRAAMPLDFERNQVVISTARVSPNVATR